MGSEIGQRFQHYNRLVEWFCRIHRYGTGPTCCPKATRFGR